MTIKLHNLNIKLDYMNSVIHIIQCKAHHGFHA